MTNEQIEQYRNFDLETVMDSEYYAKHVSAMTGEKLHSKSDIAAELAYRDKRIAELGQERDSYKEAIDHECVLWDFTVNPDNPRESIQRLLDITDCVARDTDVNKKAREFATEQQIKALEEYAEDMEKAANDTPVGAESRSRGASIHNWLSYFIQSTKGRAEQLRKGGE